MSSRGRCKHSADSFCFICGQIIKTRAKKHFVLASVKMCEAYKAYFGMPVGGQDKSWAPHFSCDYCKMTLEGKSFVRLLGCFYFHIFWNGLAYSAFLKVLLYVLKDGIMGRREPWSLVFQKYGENQPTTQAIATFVWLIHPHAKLEKMLLPLNIRIFLLQFL